VVRHTASTVTPAPTLIVGLRTNDLPAA